jgi:hypothetical protein
MKTDHQVYKEQFDKELDQLQDFIQDYAEEQNKHDEEVYLFHLKE